MDRETAGKMVTDHFKNDIVKWNTENGWDFIKQFNGFNPEAYDYVFQIYLEKPYKIPFGDEYCLHVSIDLSLYTERQQAVEFVIVDIAKDDYVVGDDFIWKDIGFNYWPSPNKLREVAKQVIEKELKRIASVSIQF
jgi:hypothetical protein